MNNYTQEQLENTLQTVLSIIERCKKAQLKFVEGTSQHTLLTNRIKAMLIVETLLTKVTKQYSKEEMIEALKPIESIIHKCSKAQIKHNQNTTYYKRFEKLINEMSISKDLLTKEIGEK